MSTTAPANERLKTATRGPFLRRVKIRDYKSIAYCDVELGSLTVLVGRNGAGKSNFLDALRFVGDALRTSLVQAVRSRGGPLDLWRKGMSLPYQFEIELDLDLGSERRATYSFEFGGNPGFGGKPPAIGISRERLEIKGPDHKVVASYEVENEELVDSTESPMPPASFDRLYLVNAAGLPKFRPVYDALLMMEFYNFSPESIKAVQTPDAGQPLDREGGNIASVIGRMDSERPLEVKERILGYLTTIVPGITDVNRIALGPKETLAFEQTVSGSESPREFYAQSMSNGTLLALGTLVAVAQLADETVPVRLVGIEEPENAIHPAAAAALMGALQEAAVDGQVIVTTHSADLLDSIDFESDRLLVAEMRDGNTVIAPMNHASGEVIEGHLFSAGELLRIDQFQPDWHDLERQMNAFQSTEPSA